MYNIYTPDGIILNHLIKHKKSPIEVSIKLLIKPVVPKLFRMAAPLLNPDFHKVHSVKF